MFKKYIARQIEKILDKQFAGRESHEPPIGYNSLDKIRGAMYHWLPVPFAGSQIWCKCRTLNKTQIDSCGDFGVLDISKSEGKTISDISQDDLIDLRNSQEAIVKAVLVQPSFNDIERMIYKTDHVMDAKKKEIVEIKKMVEDGDLTPSQKKELEDEIFKLELYTAFTLPEDTFGYLTAWGLGVEVSDMKKLSREQLYRASILAKNGNNNPSDHISGIFTDRDKTEINASAWSIYNEQRQMENAGKGKDGMRWIGGPNK